MCFTEGFEDEERGEKTWHIVEDSAFGDVAISRDEYPLDHPVSKSLMGKKVGESFFIVKDELQERKATVLEICSKYLYRYRKCYEEFPRKFPDSKKMMSSSGVNSDGTVNLELIEKVLKRDKKGTEEIMSMYEQKLIPLHMLAEYKGVSEFVVMNLYASRPELKIKTCFGANEEWNHAVRFANNAKRVILDLTSLVTLLLLDDSFWKTLPFELAISEETYSNLKNIESLRNDYIYEGGSFSYSNGRIRLISNDLEVNKAEQERAKHFIEQVDKYFDVISGVSLVEMSADKRQPLIEVIGQANAGTLVLASQENAILWTDDLALACIGNSELGCNRIWTQVVINLLDEIKKSELSLRLYSYGYAFTKIGIEDLKLALEKSKWQVGNSPLKEVMAIFSGNNITIESIAPLLGNFIKYIWQNATEFTAQQITIETLNELSKRDSGIILIKAMPVNEIFTVDCINANKVKNLIDGWLRLRIGSLF